MHKDAHDKARQPGRISLQTCLALMSHTVSGLWTCDVSVGMNFGTVRAGKYSWSAASPTQQFSCCVLLYIHRGCCRLLALLAPTVDLAKDRLNFLFLPDQLSSLKKRIIGIGPYHNITIGCRQWAGETLKLLRVEPNINERER